MGLMAQGPAKLSQPGTRLDQSAMKSMGNVGMPGDAATRPSACYSDPGIEDSEADHGAHAR